MVGILGLVPLLGSIVLWVLGIAFLATLAPAALLGYGLGRWAGSGFGWCAFLALAAINLVIAARHSESATNSFLSAYFALGAAGLVLSRARTVRERRRIARRAATIRARAAVQQEGRHAASKPIAADEPADANRTARTIATAYQLAGQIVDHASRAVVRQRGRSARTRSPQDDISS